MRGHPIAELLKKVPAESHLSTQQVVAFRRFSYHLLYFASFGYPIFRTKMSTTTMIRLAKK